MSDDNNTEFFLKLSQDAREMLADPGLQPLIDAASQAVERLSNATAMPMMVIIAVLVARFGVVDDLGDGYWAQEIEDAARVFRAKG